MLIWRIRNDRHAIDTILLLQMRKAGLSCRDRQPVEQVQIQEAVPEGHDKREQHAMLKLLKEV